MTKMNWQEWFEYQNRLKFNWTAISQYKDYDHTAEEMYQAFKARIIDEVIVADERSALMSDGLPYPPERLKNRKVLLLADSAKPKRTSDELADSET